MVYVLEYNRQFDGVMVDNSGGYMESDGWTGGEYNLKTWSEEKIRVYADDNGLYFYDKILNECRKYLNDRFIIAFEIGYKQGNDILNIINKYFDNVNISLEKELIRVRDMSETTCDNILRSYI